MAEAQEKPKQEPIDAPLSDREAADQIEALGLGTDDEQPQDGNAGAQNSDAPGNAEASEGEGGKDGDEPAPGDTEASADDVEMPEYWDQDIKDALKALTPEARQKLVEQGKKASKAVDAKMREAADTRKAAEAAKTQYEAVTSQNQAVLGELQQRLPVMQAMMVGKWANVDWDTLARTDHQTYTTLKHEYEKDQSAWQQVGQTYQNLVQQQTNKTQETIQRLKVEAHEKLVREYPTEFAGEKAKATYGEMTQYVKSAFEADGLDVDMSRLSNIVEAPVFKIIRKAMLYDKAQKAKSAAAKPAQQPAARNVKPSPRQPDANQKRNFDEAMERLQKTGSDKDAERAIAALGIE